MLNTILFTLLIVTICILLLGIKVFFVKGGKFPNGHVSGNKALRDRGISCAQSQDREAQKKSRFSIDALELKTIFLQVMKRINCLINGLAALALIVLFSQCAGKADTKTTTSAGEATANTVSGDLKIAYVEVDTLLSKYNFCIDLNEAMMKKEENIRLTLNQKAATLDKDQKEFQKKYENNAFISPERAQQEYNRLMKMQQDLQALQNKLTNELAAETQKNSLQLRDSINVFLKEYNKTKGYNLILSNTGFDNLLYADSSFNITQEIIDGLNARYTSAAKK